MSLGALYACRNPQRPKRPPDALKTELWVIDSHCVAAGSKTKVFCKISQHSELLSHHSSPFIIFLFTHIFL